jgi:hypothetical protein
MSERTEGDDTCPDCGGVTPCPLDCTGSTGPADAIVEWLGPEDADEAQCSTDDLIAALDVVRDSCDTHDDDGRSDEQVIRAAMKRLARLAGPADAGSHDPNDIETVVDFVLGWFPGYEDAIHWGSEGPRGERKETNAVYQAALRLAASASAPAATRLVNGAGACPHCRGWLQLVKDEGYKLLPVVAASAPAVPRETKMHDELLPGSTAKANPEGSAPVGPTCVCHQGSVCGPACLIGVCHTGCFSWPTAPETK